MQAVVAFRGTQPTKGKDIVTNLDIRPFDLPPAHSMRTVATPPGSRSDNNPQAAASERPLPPSCLRRCVCGARSTEAAVHRGFHKSVASILPRIEELLDLCTGGDPTWRVCATGHSLGAALATICAYELATRNGCDTVPFHQYKAGDALVRCSPVLQALSSAFECACKVSHAHFSTCVACTWMRHFDIPKRSHLAGVHATASRMSTLARRGLVTPHLCATSTCACPTRGACTATPTSSRTCRVASATRTWASASSLQAGAG